MNCKDILSGISLPEEYLDFLSVNPNGVVIDTEDYGELEIYGANTLHQGQNGYSYNPVTDEPIEDWNQSLIVIASAGGDPFCIDRTKEDSPVYFAFHGEEWDFNEEYPSITAFLEEVTG